MIMFISFDALSQARLGYSYTQIYDEFYDNVTSFIYNKNILATYDFYEAFYRFNESGDCISTMVVVKDIASADFFKNKYNNELLKINSTTWTKPLNGFNIYCVMSYEEDIDAIIFVWSYNL